MKIYHDLIQGSDEWFRVRKGRPTASNADRILTPNGKQSSQWRDYAIELIAETLTPREIPKFTGNAATDHGSEMEPFAREEFARVMRLEEQGLELVQVGFVTRDDQVVGCSPDSLIYRIEDAPIEERAPIAGVEIKCPLELKTHAGYVLDGGIPPKYVPQVHFSMAVTGLPWYFMSYCPPRLEGDVWRVPLIVKAEPDEYTEKMRQAIDEFVIYYAEARKKFIPVLQGKNAIGHAPGEKGAANE